MPMQSPKTQTMTLSDAETQFSRLAKAVSRRETRVLVEEAGIPVAALVSAEDLQRLTQFDRDWEERTEALERFSQAFADIPTEQAEEEVARIIAARRQRRSVEIERQSA
jgi:prevent-host-death family protein